jgi:hydroxymethylglutaryl-CoA lyase
MTEYDYWKIFPRMPKKVTIGDITIRDGFQHEEKFVSTAAKIFYAEEMIMAGCREIELTNLGSPESIPQFKDSDQVLAHFRSDRFKKRCEKSGINPDSIIFTAVTIRENAVDRAIELKKRGIGPDRILMMVSSMKKNLYPRRRRYFMQKK